MRCVGLELLPLGGSLTYNDRQHIHNPTCWVEDREHVVNLLGHPFARTGYGFCPGV